MNGVKKVEKMVDKNVKVVVIGKDIDEVIKE